MPNTYSVLLSELVEEFNLELFHQSSDYEKIHVMVDDISRPGLHLAGFFEHFEPMRVYVCGTVESAYLQKLSSQERLIIFDHFLSYKIPALIFARGIPALPECLEMAKKHDVTVLSSKDTTSYIVSNLITYLKGALAPRVTRHGVLVEIYGEGVLIMGESGIGKSETAVELLKRGHRLIADDAVELKKISSHELVGSPPAVLKHYVELRGVGVAKIHSEILKDDLFRDWYAVYPDRFQNKTNGITPRRWLGLCDPELCALLDSRIGAGYLTDLDKLEGLRAHLDDATVEQFLAIKQEKKRQLCAVIERQEGVRLDPSFIFDVQVKRLHEYKRQLMNALSVMDLYLSLKDGTLTDFTPTAVIFGAKAAPGYARAKAIIRYINRIAALVNADPATNDRLKVVFVQNYNCSYAEHIIPAADISEQISPAGTEASGTGNMKLMLNGALTLGTLDGANVEIVERAGRENNYIFGGTVEELNAAREAYDPKALYKADARLRRAVDTLIDGTVETDDDQKELYTALLDGASWHAPDPYFVLYDFGSYRDARLRANRDYRDRLAFGRKALENIAAAGYFSSDRTIREYAKDIWKI